MLIEECACFNRNVRALENTHTHMLLQMMAVHNFLGVFKLTSVNIGTQITSRDTLVTTAIFTLI